MNEAKQKIIVIAGSTASGKTDSAIALAKALNGEIVSADSMQIYKYMDIGTAKPSLEEQQGVPHYLIDELYPDEEYSVAVFQKKAREYIANIASRGKTPIVCGGTGFYINALIQNNDFTETEKDTSYRDYLTALATEKGVSHLYDMLKKVDIESTETIHENNVKRVIRALEYFEQTGEKISVHNKREQEREPFYDAKMIILNWERQTLYERIDSRVDRMVAQGLVEEVSRLLEKGYSENLVSMQGLGYKEIVPHLKGETTLDEAIRVLKRDTRHFAKRQITWFTHQTKIAHFLLNLTEKSNPTVLTEKMLDYIIIE